MRRRLARYAGAAALALGATATAAAGLASAQSAPISAARLDGTYQLAGRITHAVNVFGEHRGKTFIRVWRFAAQCASGPCATVLLTRPRAGGIDTVMLSQRRPGLYVGTGRFYAPLRCRGRVNPRGELVPFEVTVTITAAIVTPSGGDSAVRVNATYLNRARQNRTLCVVPPSHDAATYHGHIIQSG
jgi:hypothetical protein